MPYHARLKMFFDRYGMHGKDVQYARIVHMCLLTSQTSWPYQQTYMSTVQSCPGVHCADHHSTRSQNAHATQVQTRSFAELSIDEWDCTPLHFLPLSTCRPIGSKALHCLASWFGAISLPYIRWQKCLLHSVEDQGSVFAPILLQSRQQHKASLQDLIEIWQLADPFVYIFLHLNRLIWMQLNLFPNLDNLDHKIYEWIHFVEPS